MRYLRFGEGLRCLRPVSGAKVYDLSRGCCYGNRSAGDGTTDFSVARCSTGSVARHSAAAVRPGNPLMIHPADFHDSHARHWEDAEVLFGRDRWANADQLYGLSAECGLKAVMKVLGMPVDTSGKPEERRHQKHVNELWPEFLTFADGRLDARYLQFVAAHEPFNDWSIHNRYANRDMFSKAGVDPHRDGANEINTMIELVKQDGLL